MPYPGPGYIREEKDVMYLILYALHFFPVAITESDLMDVVLIDDAFGYFEFRSAFQRLLDSRHVAMVMDHGEPMYFLTPEGGKAIDALASNLPRSVRDKAEASIKATHRDNPDGTYTVQLRICDKTSDHIKVEVLAMTRRQCQLLEDNFRRNAEHIYHEMLLLLSGAGTVE